MIWCETDPVLLNVTQGIIIVAMTIRNMAVWTACISVPLTMHSGKFYTFPQTEELNWQCQTKDLLDLINIYAKQ